MDDIKFNGQEAPNGGFETLKPDLSAPRIWNLAPKSKACLVDDARQGKKAMKINHDNRIGQGVKVEAGEKLYDFTLCQSGKISGVQRQREAASAGLPLLYRLLKSGAALVWWRRRPHRHWTVAEGRSFE
ncbi:MAG: hypothetical protein L6W00_23305 [Lentisphaeria bacterium]|nr:MAG: hypothetical protein L6W00_23305 [Lentisphaeria bacterium]